MSKLILIEGIPGSGKTTAARFVHDWLQQHGQRPTLFLEGDLDHPADFESVAWLDARNYLDLQARFPEQTPTLTHYAQQEDNGWLLPYRKLQQQYGEQLPDTLIEALARCEIYDLPAAQHTRLLLQRWQNFVARASGENTTYVFECCFLQNPLTTLLARHNLAPTAIRQHLLALARLVRPLQPKLVYLEQQDVRTTLENVRQQRSQAWADFVTWYLTAHAYGQSHHLNGFEGVIEFYTTRQQLELDYIRDLPVTSLVIPNELSWAARYAQLADFLKA